MAQTQDVFTLFVTHILPALSDPSNAYNTQHMYVLHSLTEVKSVLLILDVSQSDALVLHLFQSLFDIVSGTSKTSGEQIGKGVEYNMTQMLVSLVDEASSLPTEVVDIIVAQFLRAGVGLNKTKKEMEADDKQSKLLSKELPPAYNMAKVICNSTPEKMSRYISQYFNDVIMEATPGRNGHRDDAESDDGEAAGPTEADIKELNKAHILLRELWRASPAVLQNVIPQLEAELSADNVSLRLLATETLGDIVSGIGAAGPPPPPVMDPAAYPPATLEGFVESNPNASVLTTPKSPQSFAQTHPTVYHSFLGRKNDKSPIIRSAWTTAIGRILVTNAGDIGLGREDEHTLVKSLSEKLNDADERVRLAAVKAVGFFGFRDIMSKLAASGDVNKSGSVLCSLADRARDRKHSVRVEGMTTLARIWGVAVGEIASGNDAVISLLGSIPTKVFDAYYANDQDLNVLLDRVMFEQLLPLSYPPTKKKLSNGDSQASQSNGDGVFDPDKIRTQRILLLVRSLDAKSKRAFFAMLARQPTFSQVLTAFLKRCEEFNGGVTENEDPAVVKQKMTTLISWTTGWLPDPPRVSADLWKFAKLHDRRTYHLIKLAMSPETDFNTAYKALKETSRRIEGAPGAPAGILETLTPLFYRSALLVYNRSHLPAILQYARNDEGGLGATAHEVLNEISERIPTVFKSHIKELCKQLEEQAPTATKENSPDTFKSLKACAAFARKYPKEIPQDRKFLQALSSFAQYGTPPKAAKYAVSILMAATDRKEMHARDLVTKATKGWKFGSGHFLTRLATMSQLSLLEPKTTEEASDEILDIATQEILLKVRTPASDDDPQWQSDSEIDEECQAKCWALKILVNRLRTIEDPEIAKTTSDPVFRVLNTLIKNSGELSKNNDTPTHHKSRLRLLAAQLCLKLCTRGIYENLFHPEAFNRLACVAQDSLYQVRRNFIEKLQKYLASSRLSSRFYTVIFLMAFEPDAEFRTQVQTWLRSRVRHFEAHEGSEGKRQIVMEITMARLLSLLAHHPDYSPAVEDILDHARYILFYITSVLNPSNLALVLKFAERVKQTQDAFSPAKSENLYILSDLAQALIRKWQEKKGWSLQSWPGKVRLPAGLFKALPDHETAQRIAEKNYLPDGVDEGLDALVRNAEKKKVCNELLTLMDITNNISAQAQEFRRIRRTIQEDQGRETLINVEAEKHATQEAKNAS
jgi:sister-chromatid-cohesion protein PDS5